MKRPLVLVLLAVAVASGVCAVTVSAEPGNAINLGLGGGLQLMPHCNGYIVFAEYERMLGSNFAVLGRGSQVHYKFDDSSFMEDGKMKGADVGVRYYTGGNGMKGFYIGGGLGYWTADWTFTDFKGTASETQGKGSFNATRADVDIGGRYSIGSSSVSIIPAVHLGKYFKSATCEYTAPASRAGTSCNKDGEVGYYGFLALSVGVGF